MQPVNTGSELAIADIGGRPVAGGRFRTGLLYRVSGALVGRDDLAHLGGVGLRRLFDMRSEVEDREQLSAWAAGQGIDYRHFPVSIGRLSDLLAMAHEAAASAEVAARILRSVYLRILDEQGRTLAGIVDAMVDGLPAGFGCAAGKDRTGVLAALIQSAVGVDDAAIVEDYRKLAPDVGRLRKMLVEFLPSVDPNGAGISILLGAAGETMEVTLAHLAEGWGGAAGYLEAHGLAADRLGDLRRHLIET
ncbi:MAG: tyrosine-protein phosphatase [Acidimicrobiia bacterium]